MSAKDEVWLTRLILSIRRSDQPLPVEMDRFWASCENKVRFQEFFTKWITENYTDDKPLFLGGSNANDETTYLRTMSGNVQQIRLLKCDHEKRMIESCFT